MKYQYPRLLLVAAAFCLLLSPAVLAQETTGAIQGVVKATDGSVLPGVTVTARSFETSLTRTVVSEGDGSFNVPALQLGRYSVSASLEGFHESSRDVRVNVGATTTVNIEMVLGTAETIVVTAATPLVDVESTTTGLTLNVEELNARLPVNRDITQVSLLAPGTMQGDTAFGDEGDSGTPGQNLISIGGASVAENSYQVNGLNITNFRNGVGSNLVPFEFVDQVQIKTGGYEAEFGRSTGGVVNMVTKRGGNEFIGMVSAYYEPESLQETEPNTFQDYNESEQREILEANLSLSGPVWRDRAFFYGFFQHRDRDILTIDAELPYRDTTDDPFWGGRLDLDLTASHHLEGTYFTDEVTINRTAHDFDVATETLGEVTGTGTRERGGQNYIGKYTGIFGQRMVLSGQFGGNEFARTDQSSEDDQPYFFDGRSGSLIPIGTWVNPLIGSASDERTAYRVDGDWFLGRHTLSAGADMEDNHSSDLTQYSGGVYYRYYLSSPILHPQVPANTNLVRVRYFQGGGEFDTLSSALYIQDNWELLPNLQVNLGLRSESYNNKNANGESFIKVDHQIAPRVGFIYDPSSSGRTKIYGNYGRYHLPIASNTNIRLSGAEFFTEDYYVVAGEPPLNGTPPTLGQLLTHTVFGSGEIPDPRATKADDLKPMYQDEIILGFERQIGINFAVGLRGVARQFGSVIEDITLDGAIFRKYGVEVDHAEYRLANPGSSFSGWADIDHDGEVDRVEFTADELGYPEAERNYYAAELTFQRMWAGNWMVGGSYTWSHSYGNYEGYVRSDNGQDDAGITTLFDYAGLLENGYGDLPNDRRHNLKAFGAYAFDFRLQLGGSLSFRTGRPINAFGVHPTDPFSASYGNESFFDQGQPVPRGSRGRTDDVYQLDLTARYDIPFGPAELGFRIDVFNVLNSDNVAEVAETADEDSGAPYPNYLEPTHYQLPRQVRFGASIRF